MDTNTLLLWLVVILAVVAVIAFVVYRRRTRTTITGPFNASLTIDASNDPPPAPTPPGVTMKGVTAGKDVNATAKTGGGVDLQNVTAQKGSVTATAENPSAPKAPPPT